MKFWRNPAFYQGAARGLYEVSGDPFANPVLAAILGGRQEMEYAAQIQAEEQERQRQLRRQEEQDQMARERHSLALNRFARDEREAESAAARQALADLTTAGESAAAESREQRQGAAVRELLGLASPEEQREFFRREEGPYETGPWDLDPSDALTLYRQLGLRMDEPKPTDPLAQRRLDLEERRLGLAERELETGGSGSEITPGQRISAIRSYISTLDEQIDAIEEGVIGVPDESEAAQINDLKAQKRKLATAILEIGGLGDLSVADPGNEDDAVTALQAAVEQRDPAATKAAIEAEAAAQSPPMTYREALQELARRMGVL